MLRFLVLLLALLNGLYFAWSQGLLRAYGLAPAQQSEPQRVAQQIRPQDLRILGAEEARRAETPAAVAGKPSECLQAGLFDEAQAEQLRLALGPVLPAGAWQIEPAVEPARWIVYMGKYPSADALLKKRTELASLNLKFEPLGNPALEFGLSLGGFDTQAAAAAALDVFSRRGVRTARVVQERVEVRGVLLKIAAVDEALRTRLEEIKPALAGKPLRTCR
jgi:hypothetical protein